MSHNCYECSTETDKDLVYQQHYFCSINCLVAYQNNEHLLDHVTFKKAGKPKEQKVQ